MPVIDAQSAAALVGLLTDLVAKAGAAVLSVNRDRMKTGGKIDGSPVTDADLAADNVIAEGLARLCPDIPVLSEERAHLATPPYSGSLFVIDPLDGTKEFIAGRNEYTVNLAIVTEGMPLLGIIGAPALGSIWRGLVGRGAERLTDVSDSRAGVAEPIRTRPFPAPNSQWIAAVSRSHADSRSDAFISRRPGAVRKPLGSAVKFCRIAEGCADIYPRLAPTCEWDVAAGHALVTAAGGKVTDESGAPLRFGEAREGFLVPGFIAWGDPSAAPL
ncbi:3'(2'),5'-bisphosphate nucleotidase [Nitrobacter winogradskyi Nb-255]|uniref:3'(2'),5'-bisphosphate nucleotidase CysQ n=1 Tax=Nitrobacter winogradskyi (strain ATCC 25391 / DSM 10237 / CIP 104748 / NCIMB 11846 / Nb-255) TaxID=323098 RepID=Q3SVA6_NITWN|nr:3'(2'),5'-bisphosphate nucleotidase CysQ [Nitrobacter winogradskyi]ABA03785.1 3'(2'),5'-bisphosphate nucleotidase [Nitrobacter winogradskyi Nb-255]